MKSNIYFYYVAAVLHSVQLGLVPEQESIPLSFLLEYVLFCVLALCCSNVLSVSTEGVEDRYAE